VSATPLRAPFAAALRKVGGEVHDLADAKDPRAPLVEIARSLLPAADASGERPRADVDRDPGWARLPIAEIAREAGFEAIDPAAEGSGAVSTLARCALGITLADLAVAETGTVVQLSRPWRPRSISLLPPCHLVILPEDRIVGSFEDLFSAAEAEIAGDPGWMTLITGPSRTADIEKVLTVGVHGPGRVAVVVVR